MSAEAAMPWELAGAAGVFLLTFVSEDSATLGAAALALVGKLAWPLAFAACFTGIWVGDLGLFLLARVFGRPVLARVAPRSADRLARSEAWFSRFGPWALVVSRFVPGSRLPTFVTAGLLRMPIAKFAAITAVLAAVWVALVFGSASLGWPGVAAIIGLIVAGVTARWWAPRVRRWWREWEFWPAWLFYLPVAGQYLRLACRHGGLTVPCAANPGMFTGGLVGESKFETLRDLARTSPEFTAATFLLPADMDRAAALAGLVADGSLAYPLVLKPDVGQRGSGFRVVRDAAVAKAYFERTAGAVLAQAYVAGPHEVGIFYYRFPHEERGRILAITEKVFPFVTGDGERSLGELVRADPRAGRMERVYLARLDARRIPAAGERVRLVEAGNHAQGCIFQDGMHRWTPDLEARIDAISRAVPGFFVGRYDVRFAAGEDLGRGEGFWILELNGAASEATSAYDARKTLREAYALLFRQWEIVFAIGAANCRGGHAPPSWRTIWREVRRQRRSGLGSLGAD